MMAELLRVTGAAVSSLTLPVRASAFHTGFVAVGSSLEVSVWFSTFLMP